MPALKSTNRFLVAENHDLPGILDSSKTTSLKLFGKLFPAHVSVDVSKIAAHHLSITGGFGREYISDPLFRIDRAMIVQHGPILVFLG
ncbi:MAG: hypothetical protein AAF280_13240 [Pseudomonadota bacterium]